MWHLVQVWFKHQVNGMAIFLKFFFGPVRGPDFSRTGPKWSTRIVLWSKNELSPRFVKRLGSKNKNDSQCLSSNQSFGLLELKSGKFKPQIPLSGNEKKFQISKELNIYRVLFSNKIRNSKRGTCPRKGSLLRIRKLIHYRKVHTVIGHLEFNCA